MSGYDVTLMTDEELDSVIANGAIERARREQRAKIDAIPAQIAELAEEYTRATGQPVPPVEAAQQGANKGKSQAT
jgi:hypothetical protein